MYQPRSLVPSALDEADSYGTENEEHACNEEHRCLTATDKAEYETTTRSCNDLRKADCTVEETKVSSDMLT